MPYLIDIGGIAFWPAAGATFLFVLAVAVLLHYAVEKPALRLIRGRFGG